ncbi:hypothetical protein F5146DRAFT_189844 [Armillaria mellea]|nr:hypothetical protein F5146DRAFT_189844 [Armillaria mellea]
MAPVSLPQELVDSAFEYLHDDIPALRQCILVSRSYRAAAQGHLYHQVILVRRHTLLPDQRKPYAGAWYTCANFYHLICSYPHIPPLVRSFVVHDGLLENPQYGYPTITERLFHEDFLPRIFPLLPCPRRIVITNRFVRFGSDGLPSSLKSSIRDAFRSLHITSVHLDGLEQVDQGWLVSLFEECPSLKHLSLTWFNEFGRRSFPLDQKLLVKPINASPALESLSFADEIPCIVEILFTIQPLFNISRLRKLSIHSRFQADCPIIQILLDATQDCLEELTLRTQRSLPMDPLPRHVLDVTRNTELRSVSVVVDAVYPEWPMIIPFSTILQGLTIEVVFWPGTDNEFYGIWHRNRPSLDGIGRRNWSSLDACVSQNMPSLRNINVKLHATTAHARDDCTNEVCTGRTRSVLREDMSDTVQYVRQHLPTLGKMAILQVEEIDKRTTWGVDDTLCSSVF